MAKAAAPKEHLYLCQQCKFKTPSHSIAKAHAERLTHTLDDIKQGIHLVVDNTKEDKAS